MQSHRDDIRKDLRIHTKIYDYSNTAGQNSSDQEPVIRSLMLFHAGKVYDYIDPAQEVIVFEPAFRRFTILNGRRQVCSELYQDDIRRFLGLADVEVQKHLAAAFDESSSGLRRSLELLQFQLKPNFTTFYDATKSHLSLSSPQFHYQVDAFTPENANIAEKYLHVADWTAQANSVLHPQSLLPGPRMALNQELRLRGLVPTTVELKAGAAEEIHLVAQHEWTWKLLNTDHQLIADWEKQLQDPKLRRLPFRQFQQQILKIETARRR